MTRALVWLAVMVLAACSGGGGDPATVQVPEAEVTGAPTPAPSPTEVDPGAVESVRMGDFVFDPDEIGATAGEERTLQLPNTGAVEHTFTNKDLGIDTEVDDGAEGSVTFTVDKPGTYEIICRFHKRMTATLTVE